MTAAVLVCASCLAAPASASTKLVVTGRGWGHGVGMSQWGAYGFAAHGWTWQRILAHYYTGTTLGDAPIEKVRVLLADPQPAGTVGCAGAIRVGDATGQGFLLPPGNYSIGPQLRLPVGHKRLRVGTAHHRRGRFVTVPAQRKLRSPVVFDCPSAPLTWEGRPYHGTLVVRHTGKKVSAVNTVSIDEYVRGVVASEMPYRWSIAALAAQAVASRSYALATLKPEKNFDLFADTRSQVYGGVDAETSRTNLAVEKTAGKVVMWNGQVATTFFFSTSGGRTADVREVWPQAGNVPYLRSVSDPYDSRSPHHAWGPITLDASRVARMLNVPVGELKVVNTPDGRVASVRVGSRTIDGDTFRQKLGLASTWFSVGELSLVPSRSQVTFGGKVAIALRSEGLGRAKLQRRIGAGAWKTLASVDGSDRVSVEPQADTLYRLSAGTVTGPVVVVGVAPTLSIDPVAARELTGDVEPVSRGAVTVSRRVAGAWKVVAHPQIDPQGHFSAPLQLRRGAYRVEIASDGRYASTSAGLTVTARLLASLEH